MSARSIIQTAFLLGIVQFMIGKSTPIHYSEALLLTSAAALLVMGDSLRWQRRILAVEKFLSKTSSQLDTSTIQSSVLHIDSSIDDCKPRLLHFLSEIIGERHPKTSRKHHDHVRDHVADHMKRLGWQVRLEPVVGPHGPGANVIAERKGTSDSAEILIVGAHYDTVVGTPGADDNGIALAGIMAIAELLQDFNPVQTIRLVAWDLEEQQGFGKCLLGSKEMVRNIKRTNEKVLGVICLEMIGMCEPAENTQACVPGLRWVAPKVYHQVKSRQNRGDFIALVGNKSATDLMDQFASISESQDLPTVSLSNGGLVGLVRDLRRSDHAPFWDARIPAIMVTDTSNFRSPFYHTAMDRIEMIDFEFASKVVLSTAQLVARIAGERTLGALFDLPNQEIGWLVSHCDSHSR